MASKLATTKVLAIVAASITRLAVVWLLPEHVERFYLESTVI